MLSGGLFPVLLAAAFLVGGMSNPLYSLLMAYTNDYLQLEDMAAASGGMIFINGVGAISGPLITGWAMGFFGPMGYFLYIGALMVLMSAYAAYRATVRPSVDIEETTSYAPVTPSASLVTLEFAQEYAVAEAEEDEKTE